MAYGFTLAASKYLEITSNVIDYNAVYWFSFLIKFNQLTTFDTMLCISDGTSNNRDLLILDTTVGNTLATRVNVGGAQTTQAGTTVLSTGVWYHILMLRDAAASLKIYLNGSLELTNTRNTAGRAAASQLRFGVEQTANNPINADMGIMKAATSNPGLNSLVSERHKILPVNASNLYGWWPMLKNAQRNRDYSGKGHHWVENGVIADVENPPVGWGLRLPRQSFVPTIAPVITRETDYLTVDGRVIIETSDMRAFMQRVSSRFSILSPDKRTLTLTADPRAQMLSFKDQSQ